MTRSPKERPDLNDLLGDLCNEALGAEGLQHLNEQLHDNPDAQREYLLYADLHAALRHFAQSCDDEEFALREAQAAIDSTLQRSEHERSCGACESSEPLRLEQTTLQNGTLQIPTFRSFGAMWRSWSRPAFGLSIAVALMVALGIEILSSFKAPLPGTEVSALSADPAMSGVELGPAHLTGAVGARWAGERLEMIEGTQFTAGQRLELVEGLAEVCFLSGARVIIQGPAILQILDENRVSVPLGRVAATIPAEADQFTLLTDVATVTSGTAEYGIEVEVDKSLVSQVYGGVVQMKLTNGSEPTTNMELIADQGLKINAASGQVKQLQKLDQLHFVRYLPEHDVLISLADIVAGGSGIGDGSSEGYHRGVSVLDGKAVSDYGAPVMGDGKYHKAAALGLIDGVFIPDGKRGSIQVDSIGRTFADFPETANECWGGVIMARRPALERSLPFIRLEFHGDNYGYVNWLHIASHPEELSPQGYGLIGMHSNCGITFDLHAIRALHPNKKVVRFRARVGNLEAKQEEYLADAWVLVDGKLRYSRLGFSRELGSEEIEIPLTDRDRFLVLAVTDAGGDTAYDWVAFGDPVIESTTKLDGFVSHDQHYDDFVAGIGEERNWNASSIVGELQSQSVPSSGNAPLNWQRQLTDLVRKLGVGSSNSQSTLISFSSYLARFVPPLTYQVETTCSQPMRLKPET